MTAPGDAATDDINLRMKPKSFKAFHQADRNFFLIFLTICWLGVIMGFKSGVSLRLQGRADYPAPLILQIHAIAFSAWMLLLTAQICLVRVRRLSFHKTLGLTGAVLIPIMAVSAFFSEVYSQQFRLVHPPNSQPFFVIAIFYVVAFTALATAALTFRRDPAAHKRFILLATTIIVGAAYGRWWGTPLYDLFGEGLVGLLIYTFTGTNLILAFAAGYDIATRRRMHWVYQIGIPAILAGEVMTSVIFHSPAWLPIARVLVAR